MRTVHIRNMIYNLFVEVPLCGGIFCADYGRIRQVPL
jgi:hypothetical protein